MRLSRVKKQSCGVNCLCTVVQNYNFVIPHMVIYSSKAVLVVVFDFITKMSPLIILRQFFITILEAIIGNKFVCP